MNAIQHGLAAIRKAIPIEILEDCFLLREDFNRALPVSLESRIRQEVILNWVLPDLKIHYGVSTKIPLHLAKLTITGDPSTGYQGVYEFNKKDLNGRGIVSALSVTFGTRYSALPYPSMSTYNRGSSGIIASATNHLANSIDNANVTTISRVTLINETAIMIRHNVAPYPYGFAEVILEMDDSLSNIRPVSIPHFNKLIVLACKAYIYNRMSIKLDRGKLHAGQELGEYKNQIDNYRDALEQYEELLSEKTTKILMMNDEETMTDYIRSMLIGPV